MVSQSTFPGSHALTSQTAASFRREDERENPYNWSIPRKWLFTLVTAACTLSVSFASSGYTGALSNLVTEFDVSRSVAMLGLTLYILGVSVTCLSTHTTDDLTVVFRRSLLQDRWHGRR